MRPSLPRLIPLLLMAPAIFAQAPAVADSQDLMATPKAFRDFVIRVTLPYDGYTLKSRALARAFFAKPEDGGLGLTYANDKTRTVAEVWKDRKANCLSLTAFYVAACRAIQVDVKFADSYGVSRWVRSGGLIYHERHVVAVLPINVVDSMVADFSGEPRIGAHRIKYISEERFRALFHSNRAVELMQAGDNAGARQEADASLAEDASSAIGWNISGVVSQAMGDDRRAEAAFHKALEVDPTDGAACGNLEELCRSEGRMAEAASFRDLGMKVRDKDPYFHAFIAKESLEAGRVDEALAQIERAVKLQRMEPDFYLILAQAQLERGQRDEAEKAVEKAIHWSLPEQRKRMESKLALLQGQS